MRHTFPSTTGMAFLASSLLNSPKIRITMKTIHSFDPMSDPVKEPTPVPGPHTVPPGIEPHPAQPEIQQPEIPDIEPNKQEPPVPSPQIPDINGEKNEIVNGKAEVFEK